MPPSLGSILGYSAIPVATAICGGLVAAWKPPGVRLAAAVQHFAAGVVFAAAASELLPDVLHQRALLPTLLGGAAGVAVMVSVKTWARRAKGAQSLIAITAVDILVDGLVVGVGFLAGMRQGMLLTFALSIELLFLGLSVAAALAQTAATPSQIVTATGGLALLLPVGTIGGVLLLGRAPTSIQTGFYAFGLVALLYLVTEELLVEAHEHEESPVMTAVFFAGFFLLVIVEELLQQ